MVQLIETPKRPYVKSLATILKESIPPGSFIATYLEMMSTQETPLAYDLWCALWCLSNAGTRWAVVDRPRAPVRLNTYIILAAESGVTRKSTAVNTAVRIVADFIDRSGAAIELINTKTTPERLDQILDERSKEYGHAHFAFGVSELVTALGSERYNLAMPGLLTDLYDSPTERRTTGTIARGATAAQRVYGTFLSASTPSWLMRAINPDVIEGGFTSRCYFIVQEDRKQVVAWPTGTDRDFEGELAERLCTVYNSFMPPRLAQFTEDRRFQVQPDGLEAFKSWYNDRKLSHDPFLSSFEAREDSHILKVAALLAINAERGYITGKEIETARWLIKDVKETSSELLSYGASHEVITVIEKVREQLLRAGTEGIKHRDLLVKCANITKSKRLAVILNVMHRLEMVKRFEYKGETGRPGTLWVGSMQLASADFLKMMMEEMQGEET